MHKRRISKQVSIHLDYSVSEKITTTNSKRKETVANYTDLFDNEKYPKTRSKDIVDWIEFTKDFESKDIPFDVQY